MKRFKRLNWKDVLFLLGTGCFFFSCIATSHRSAKVMKPGQFSGSAVYYQVSDTDDDDADPLTFIGADARVGVARGIDVGLLHAFDITKDTDGIYKSAWFDAKFQLLNLDNEFMKPVISLGVMKGLLYDSDVDMHVLSIPVMFGLPMNDIVTPFFTYRFEVIGDKFIPTSDHFDDPRHTFVIGAEFNLFKSTDRGFMPKLAVSVGTMNSVFPALTNPNEDQPKLFMFNVGLIVNSVK